MANLRNLCQSGHKVILISRRINNLQTLFDHNKVGMIDEKRRRGAASHLSGCTFALIVILLTAVTLLACWIPARRAASMDPLVSLRVEWGRGRTPYDLSFEFNSH
jgi:hypothetical protein